ncbi:MAG: ArnT family glycosyltransferase [Candidatus Binatia bacterium]
MPDPLRRIVWVVLLVALGLRLAFVLTLPPRPPYWDEPFYELAATRYLRAVDGTGEVTLSDAFRGSLMKGEVYSVTVALMHWLFGPQPRAMFVLQAGLDTLTCLLLFSLARSLGGVGAGVIALTLAALYEPFIFAAARGQTETLASLLYVAGLWAICVPERRRTACSFGAGIVIAATMLVRPALQGLFPLFLPAIIVRNWGRTWRHQLAAVLVFAAGFFVVIGPRLVLTAALTGTPVWSGTMDPGPDLYAGAVFANVGWKTDGVAYQHPPSDELLAVIGNPPTRKPRMRDLRAATVRIWRAHPVESTRVALHKLYVAWVYPYNDSQWSFLTSIAGQQTSHRVLLALALIGMPLSLQRWRVAVPLILTTLYLWLTYVVVKIEVRYAVYAMPMMICFAAVALAVLSGGVRRAWRSGQGRRLVALAAVTVAGLVAATTLSIARLIEWLPLTPDAAHGVRVVVILAVIGWLAYLTAELARHRWRRATVLALLAPSFAIAALVLLFGRPLAHHWREWQSALAPNRSIASQEFVLPTALEPPLSAELKLDLLPDPAGGADVVVRVNGQEVKRYRGGVARGDGDLPTLAYWYESIASAQGRALKPERAWYRIPIAKELISPGNRLAVEIALEGDRATGGGLEIFGDYPPDAATYAGPSLFAPQVEADTSIYRYLAEQDFRLPRSIHLVGSSRSRFHDGRVWSDQDLGTEPGRQSGRYRIFLMLDYGGSIEIL